MKIVDVTEFYSERGGGIRSYLTDRSRFLGQHHRHLVIASGPHDEIPRDRISEVGSRLVRLAGPALPYDRTYHLLHRFGAIRRQVHSEAPDVLEAHSPYFAAAATVACGRRAARLTTAFCHTDHLGVHVEPMLAQRFGAPIARGATGALRRVACATLAPFDAVFAAGRLQAERLRAAGVPRVIHAPFGVDKTVFRPSARSEETRRRWIGDTGAETLLLVGLGRLAGEKRWDVVLEAFGRVRERRRVVLVLVGDGPERKRLERLAPPGVWFVGFEHDRTHLARLLASSDLLVHGAPCETFGLGIAEGVACGLPVVVPNAGAAPEHVFHGSGATYRQGDPMACAAAIEALLARRPEQLRACALSAVTHVLGAEQHFQRVVSAYDELLGDSRFATHPPRFETTLPMEA